LSNFEVAHILEDDEDVFGYQTRDEDIQGM